MGEAIRLKTFNSSLKMFSIPSRYNCIDPKLYFY